MGLMTKAFTLEYRRNLIALRRSYVWIIGFAAFVAVGIYYFYPLPSTIVSPSLPFSTAIYTFITQSFPVGMGAIILLLSSMQVSEDFELGTWNIMRSMKTPKLPILAAKYLWIQLYSIVGLLFSLIVFSLFTFFGHHSIPFSVSYIPAFLEVLLSVLPITGLVALQGLFISSLFSRRVYSVLVGAAFFILLTDVCTSVYTNAVLSNSLLSQMAPNITGIPILHKIVILIDPIYFQGLSAILLGITKIGYPTNGNNLGGPTSYTEFHVPLLFNNPIGYLLVYFGQSLLLIALMWIVIRLRERWL